MKKQILFTCAFSIFIFLIGKSQSNKRYIYYLDTYLSSVEKSKAVILGEGVYENGLFKLDCFSINKDKLFLTVHCTDSTLTNFEGQYISYHLNGKQEIEGDFQNGDRKGIWQKWDTLGRKVDSTIYEKDKAILVATFDYHNNGTLKYFTIKDSLLNTYQTISYSEEGLKSSEVFFKGQKGILKTYTEEKIQTDSLFTREEIEAEFPGGQKRWRLYLEKNLNPSVPVNHKAPKGLYTVIVKFVIQKDGSVEDIVAETSNGFGMEDEVLRIIKKCPKWIPAIQYGRNVKAFRRQPVSFEVSY